MSIQIQINGESAAEVVHELSVLAASLAPGKAPAAPVVVAEAPKAEKLKGSRAAAKSEVAPKEESPVKPAEQPKAGESEETDGDYSEFDGEEEGQIPDDVELRALAAEIGKKGVEAKKAIKALLEKYGSPNITGVPADKRIAFKADLGQI